jgi:hypothetical protein
LILVGAHNARHEGIANDLFIGEEWGCTKREANVYPNTILMLDGVGNTLSLSLLIFILVFKVWFTTIFLNGSYLGISLSVIFMM